jgi:DNA-binding transcriptional regulator/RsmH inhibitor MraZ
MSESRVNAVRVDERLKSYLRSNGYDEVYIAEGLTKETHAKCLNVFTEKEWNRQEKKLKSTFNSKQSKAFAEKFSGRAGRVNLAGREYSDIPVPEELQKWIILEDVVLVARSNRIEIWTKNDWEKSLTNFRDRCYSGKGVSII